MMNQQDIFRKVGNILTELNEQYGFLAQNPTQLNDLELELFLANASFLSDHVHILQKLNTGKPAVNTVPEHKEIPAPVTVDPVADVQALQLTPETEVPVEVSEPEQDVEEDQLTLISEAEEQEARIDLDVNTPSVVAENIVEEPLEIPASEENFFKPDQEGQTFEFLLNKHITDDDQFDFEKSTVTDIFDRPLSKEEEEILAQKKRIREQEESVITDESEPIEEEEQGPEPFLISVKEEVIPAVTPIQEFVPEPVVPVEKPVSAPVLEDRPIFTPSAIPVKPVTDPAEDKKTPTLNDLLAKTTAKPAVGKPPIADLKQAINLNEKLLFIKDLFNGYNLAYSEAIDLVNKMNSFEAADAFLQSNYAVKNNWAAKQSTVDQFYELLNRRFS